MGEAISGTNLAAVKGVGKLVSELCPCHPLVLPMRPLFHSRDARIFRGKFMAAIVRKGCELSNELIRVWLPDEQF